MFVGYLPDIAKKFKKNEILAKVFGYLYDALDEDSEVFRRISKMQAGETFGVYFYGGVQAIEQGYSTKSPKEAIFESHQEKVNFKKGINRQGNFFFSPNNLFGIKTPFVF